MEKLLNRPEKKILELLTAAGYEAYFVGGCVRDAIMGRASSGDVDVATNALPKQVQEVFSSFHVIPTGIKHGTVTVLLPEADHKIPVEVTTYRSDGDYSDNRHPDRVAFLSSIEGDLARRDFTVNAIACDRNGNLKDPFGGIADIEAGIIRAVGDADRRFQEDALRIMRALRFASVLGFTIDAETEEALFRNKHLLQEISAERFFVELKKLVAGKDAGNIVRKYAEVLGAVIPELTAMQGFEQHNPYHKYDVLEHCIRAMEAVKTTPENLFYMRLAALFHDVGKPGTYSMDEKGIGHFYGHAGRSTELVRGILQRLKADRFTTERVAILVKYHDLVFQEDPRLLKKWMNRLGSDVLQEILEIKLADNFATGNMSQDLAEKFSRIRQMMQEILAEEQCFSLRDLDIKGSDIIAMGVEPGPEVGRILDGLLEEVIEGRCANEKPALLALVANLLAGDGSYGKTI